MKHTFVQPDIGVPDVLREFPGVTRAMLAALAKDGKIQQFNYRYGKKGKYCYIRAEIENWIESTRTRKTA